MSKPYTHPDSTYLTLEPSEEQDRYDRYGEDEEIGFSTRADFNNKSTRNSRLSLAYTGNVGYSYQSSGQQSQSMLLDETVPSTNLSRTDWSKQEINDERPDVIRRNELHRKRRACGDYLKEGKRWQTLVFYVFAGLVSLGLILYFTIPRAPFFQLLSRTPLTSTDMNPTTSSLNPTTFRFNANLSIAVDARASYVPVHFNRLKMTVSDLGTGGQLATGSLDGSTVPGRKITPVTIPLIFAPLNGAYSNSSDATYGVIRSSCGTVYPTTIRPSLSLSLVIEMSVRGLIGSTRTSTQISNIECPVEFPGDSP